MTEIQIGELKFDETVYPRHDVSPSHINAIAMAMNAGTVMPPIIIEKRTKRIVDGFHRGKAFLKIFDETHQIEVVEKTYKTDADFLLDAIRFNASHGLRMDTHDRAHCAILAINFGIDDKAIAAAMHVNQDYIGHLRVDRTAFVGPMTATAGKENGKLIYVPIKQTIRHMAGKSLDKEQLDVNQKLSGMNQSFYVNQVIMLIESRLINRDDDKLFVRLGKLHGILGSLLVAS